MSAISNASEQGTRNREAVLMNILRKPGISRTEIVIQTGLTAASVSRISRDLIAAGLIHETDSFGEKDRPGRKFVGLAPRGEGGFVVGIGINAFRQSVTLADFSNQKIAEWISPTAPGSDGAAFLQTCLEKAKEMVAKHVPNKSRFFGVGAAIAAELDKPNGCILKAPVFGWEETIPLAEMVRGTLGVPLALDSPSSAINKTEVDLGFGKGVNNVTTLHCSLGFGIGARQIGDDGTGMQEYGRVLLESRAPDGSGRSLSEACGGMSILAEVLGPSALENRSEGELGELLVDMIQKSDKNSALLGLLGEKGRQSAQYFSLVFDLCQPDILVLAGPLSESEAYVAGFKAAMSRRPSVTKYQPQVLCSKMKPAGASRWLAVRGNLSEVVHDLEVLKQEEEV